MIVDLKSVHNIINETGINPDKNYGQNFLVNPEISRRIFSLLDVKPNDYILEIGPGLGSITHYFTEVPNDIEAVEVDNKLVTLLNVIYYEDSNIHIINKDIRKHKITNYNKIVSNLPYNLTTEIVTYILLNGEHLDRAVLMCESETLNHFTSLEGKDYGPVSVLIHLLGDIRKQFNVNASNFYPSPKCDSSVFTIDLNKDIDREKAIATYQLAKSLFISRRKTILNNLKSYLNSDTLADSVLRDLNIDPLTRPEQISPEEYLKLYERIKTNEDVSG